MVRYSVQGQLFGTRFEEHAATGEETMGEEIGMTDTSTSEKTPDT